MMQSMAPKSIPATDVAVTLRSFILIQHPVYHGVPSKDHIKNEHNTTGCVLHHVYTHKFGSSWIEPMVTMMTAGTLGGKTKKTNQG